MTSGVCVRRTRCAGLACGSAGFGVQRFIPGGFTM